MRGPYKTRPPAGSIAELVDRFRNSPQYLGWTDSTIVAAERYIGEFMALNGRHQCADLDQPALVMMRDERARTPSAANKWLKIMRTMLGYGVSIGLLPHNPAVGIKPLRVPNPDGHRTWREDEIAAFLAHHPLGTLPHLVFTLALYTGAARVDLCALGPGNVSDGRLRYRRQKTRGREAPVVDIPVLPPLAEALALVSGHMTFLETAQGRARSEHAVGGDFARWVAETGLSGRDDYGRTLSLHGLRKALARRLAEGGASPQSIMAVMGHRSPAMAAHYAAAYDRARAADAGMEKLGDDAPAKVVRLERKPSKA